MVSLPTESSEHMPFTSKESYYETLEASSHHWHE